MVDHLRQKILTTDRKRHTMKTKANLRMRQLGDRYMIVDSDTGRKDTTAVHSLNDTAAAIWQYAQANPGFTADDVARFLTDTYNVDKATALADTRQLLDKWLTERLIEQ